MLLRYTNRGLVVLDNRKKLAPLHGDCKQATDKIKNTPREQFR